MTDIAYAEKNKRLLFNWVVPVFFRPKQIFQRLVSSRTSTWLTPLLIISIFAVVNILVAGRIKQQAALSGEITYPPDFQYYTPEQQAQYTQAIQSTQGPVFTYVLPGIAALIGVWLGWMILGGVLHLITTLLGGRGSTALSMNVVAWSSLPFALRSLVQIAYMLITSKLIASPGLSGFSPTGEGGIFVFISHFLRLLDIYVIWQVVLLILGVHLSTKLNTVKSAFGVVLTVLVILLLQSGLAYAASLLSNLSITRPFFF